MKPSSGFTQFILLLFFTVFVAGVSLIFFELHSTNNIQKSRFSNDLNTYFENNRTDSAMENDLFLQKPILQSNKGRWSDKDINNYLGFFELLSDYLDAGSLNQRDVFDYYSEYVLEAYDNKDIQKYIAETRKKGNDDAYFEKFEKMAKQFKVMNERTKK